MYQNVQIKSNKETTPKKGILFSLTSVCSVLANPKQLCWQKKAVQQFRTAFDRQYFQQSVAVEKTCLNPKWLRPSRQWKFRKIPSLIIHIKSKHERLKSFLRSACQSNSYWSIDASVGSFKLVLLVYKISRVA